SNEARIGVIIAGVFLIRSLFLENGKSVVWMQFSFQVCFCLIFELMCIFCRRCLSQSSVLFKESKDVTIVPQPVQTASVPGLLKNKHESVIEKAAHDRKVMLRNTIIDVPEPLDVSVISEIPEEHITTRRVRIFKPSKNAMQSGTYNVQSWMIEFENRERWENQLIGWGSSGDPLSNIDGWLRFTTKEDAIKFCEKNQWHYFIDEPEVTKRPIKKSYAANFSWNKRTRVGSK
ncbi:NADH dehydrogenase [ubiquinone] iron-sulfur protein 4-like protein, partial [Leptotrombidium deliense]